MPSCSVAVHIYPDIFTCEARSDVDLGQIPHQIVDARRIHGAGLNRGMAKALAKMPRRHSHASRRSGRPISCRRLRRRRSVDFFFFLNSAVEQSGSLSIRVHGNDAIEPSRIEWIRRASPQRALLSAVGVGGYAKKSARRAPVRRLMVIWATARNHVL